MNGQFRMGAISPTHYFLFVGFSLGLLFFLIGLGYELDKTPLRGFDQVFFVLKYFVSWQLNTLGLVTILVSVHTNLIKLKYLTKLNPWVLLVISGLISSILFAPLGFTADVILLNEDYEDLTKNIFEEWLSLVVTVLFAWLAINTPWVLGYQVKVAETRKEKASESKEDVNSPRTETEPNFINQIQPEKRGDILYLKSELHYLDVVTEHGHNLILYNLRDAVTEMGDAEGLKPHRSFWVQKSSVQAFKKDGRQGVLELINGEQIPVSRNSLNSIKEELRSLGIAG